MKIANKSRLVGLCRNKLRAPRNLAAFTLPEVLCATLLIAVAVATIYVGLGQGNAFTQENGLNIRAAQIIGEKMETIRLYTWDQLTNTSYIPTSFTNYFYPSGNTNQGVAFIGTLTITNTALNGKEAYSNDVRQVTVSLTWYPGANYTSGSFQHSLQASTLVAHYGMQNYVYGTK